MRSAPGRAPILSRPRGSGGSRSAGRLPGWGPLPRRSTDGWARRVPTRSFLAGVPPQVIRALTGRPALQVSRTWGGPRREVAGAEVVLVEGRE